MQSKSKMIALSKKLLLNIGDDLEILKFQSGSYDSLYEEAKSKAYTSIIIKAKIELTPEEEKWTKMGVETKIDILTTSATEDTDVSYDDRLKYNGVEYDIVKIIPIAQYGSDFLITNILGKKR